MDIKKIALVTGLVVSGISVSGVFTAAQAITINLATGLDASNSLIATGAQSDAHWTVDNPQGSSTTAPAQTVYPNNTDWFGGWLANGPNSTWIARNANITANGLGTYTRTFDLTGINLSSVSVTGAGWAIDDSGELDLNGTSIATLGNGLWGSLASFSLPTNLLNQGENNLTIKITNTDNFLEGVRLQGTLTGSAETVVPEPLNILGAIAGLGLIGGLKRKLSK